jgi:hypothetical protein
MSTVNKAFMGAAAILFIFDLFVVDRGALISRRRRLKLRLTHYI